ncbi:MAG TPA: hypothetical protein VJC03_00310, partial [bacterium]|nr:hypothetical protein [bacterium]
GKVRDIHTGEIRPSYSITVKTEAPAVVIKTGSEKKTKESDIKTFYLDQFILEPGQAEDILNDQGEPVVPALKVQARGNWQDVMKEAEELVRANPNKTFEPRSVEGLLTLIETAELSGITLTVLGSYGALTALESVSARQPGEESGLLVRREQVRKFVGAVRGIGTEKKASLIQAIWKIEREKGSSVSSWQELVPVLEDIGMEMAHATVRKALADIGTFFSIGDPPAVKKGITVSKLGAGINSETPVTNLKLAPKVEKILLDAGLDTAGKLVDRLESIDSDKISGLGKASIDSILGALSKPLAVEIPAPVLSKTVSPEKPEEIQKPADIVSETAAPEKPPAEEKVSPEVTGKQAPAIAETPGLIPQKEEKKPEAQARTKPKVSEVPAQRLLEEEAGTFKQLRGVLEKELASAGIVFEDEAGFESFYQDMKDVYTKGRYNSEEFEKRLKAALELIEVIESATGIPDSERAGLLSPKLTIINRLLSNRKINIRRFAKQAAVSPEQYLQWLHDQSIYEIDTFATEIAKKIAKPVRVVREIEIALPELSEKALETAERLEREARVVLRSDVEKALDFTRSPPKGYSTWGGHVRLGFGMAMETQIKKRSEAILKAQGLGRLEDEYRKTRDE